VVQALLLLFLGSFRRPRLRAVNRMFLKTFINKCPVELLDPVAIPILKKIVPYMLGRLTERWSYLAKLRENLSFDEDNADSQEVLDDVIIRVAAREYLDTLKAALTSRGGLDTPPKDEKETSNLTLRIPELLPRSLQASRLHLSYRLQR